MSDEKRPVSDMTPELASVADLWKAIHSIKSDTDLLVNFLLHNEKTGSPGKIAEIEDQIKANTDWRNKLTKRDNMILGGFFVIQFLIGAIVTYILK